MKKSKNDTKKIRVFNKDELIRVESDAKSKGGFTGLKGGQVIEIKSDLLSKSKKKNTKSKSKLKTISKTLSKKWNIAFLLLLIGGIVSSIVFGIKDELNSIGFIASVCVCVWALASITWYSTDDRDDITLNFKNLSSEAKSAIAIYGVAFISIIVLFAIGFKQTPASQSIVWSIIAIGVITIGLYMSDTIKNNKTDPKFVKTIFIGQSVIWIINWVLVVNLLLLNDLYSQINPNISLIENWSQMFKSIMILVAISGVIGVAEEKRSYNIDLDWNKTAVYVYLNLIVLATLALVFIPSELENQIEGLVDNVVYGGGTSSDFFGQVYTEILAQKEVQFTLVIIAINSMMILVGKALGGRGYTMVVGVLGVVGVPMLIMIMAFAGYVDAPPTFYEIFNASSWANLVYAITYTSVVGLILSLVGVFWALVPEVQSGGFDD